MQEKLMSLLISSPRVRRDGSPLRGNRLVEGKAIRHLILSQVDPLNAAPDILLELRKIGMRLKRVCDDGDPSPASCQELETLYRFILGTAYRLADILEPWEDD